MRPWPDAASHSTALALRQQHDLRPVRPVRRCVQACAVVDRAEANQRPPTLEDGARRVHATKSASQGNVEGEGPPPLCRSTTQRRLAQHITNMADDSTRAVSARVCRCAKVLDKYDTYSIPIAERLPAWAVILDLLLHVGEGSGGVCLT